MNLQSLSNQVLLSQFADVVQRERCVSREVLEYIAEIEKRRLYADEGFESTHEWLVKVHAYSHGAAGRRVSAARMLNAVPEAASKIESGELCMTTLSRAQSAIRLQERQTGEAMSDEKKNDVLENIAAAPKSDLEQSIANLFETTAPRREVVQPKCNGETRTHLTFSAEQMAKITRAAELLLHKTESASLADAIAAMAEAVIAQKDPLAKTVKSRTKENDAQVDRSDRPTRQNGVEAQATTAPKLGWERKSIAPSTINFVRRRDGDCCQFESRGGVKCGSRKFTQVDHILPPTFGGSNEPENLRVLCRTHNLLMAERVYGKQKMDSYRP